MLKKFLSLVFSVALLANCCGLSTYAQSGRVSVRQDERRNSLAKLSNTSSVSVTENVQRSAALRETVKVTSEVRRSSEQTNQRNNLSKGDKIVGIALLSGLILSAVIIANSGP